MTNTNNNDAPVPPNSPGLRTADSPIGAGLTIGFATSAAMWTAGYLLHMPGLAIPSIGVGVVLMLIQVAGAMSVGRFGPASAIKKTGLIAGLTIGLLNLLILGSLLFETSGDENVARPAAAIVVAGWLGYSLLVGLVGAWIGSTIWSSKGNGSQSWNAWLARFGIMTALVLLPLLFVGGVVTTSDSGMAVLDWPNTNGTNMFLYPLARMTGGVYYEHTHRLFGALVGLTALTLMIMTLRSDRSGKAKLLAVIVFVLITAQGVLGGYRVIETSRALALLHGVAAQVIFALLAVLAAMLTARWNDGHEPMPVKKFKKLKRLGWIAFVVVLIQIALGGLIRHFSGETLSMHSVITHAVWSLVAVGHVFAVCSKVASIENAPMPLRRIGQVLLALLGLQMLLGIVALGVAMMYQDRSQAPALRLILGTSHQTLGALVLGALALAMAWTKRSLTAGEPDAKPEAG